MTTTYRIVTAAVPDAIPDDALIRATIEAAGMWLSSFIKGSGVIDLALDYDPLIATMNAASADNQAAGQVTGANGAAYTLAIDGVPVEVLQGIDLNGAAADARIQIGTSNLARFYWFDPTLDSAADIPPDKTDGFRVMLHELLHTLDFNGWLAKDAAGYTGTVASAFDSHVLVKDGRSWFTGEHAQQAFGGPVPLTNVHLGDALSFAAGRLTGESTLMSYAAVPNGQRLSLDPVVIGVLRDLGFEVRDSQAAWHGTDANRHAVQLDSLLGAHRIVRTLDLTWLADSAHSDFAYLLDGVTRLAFRDAVIAFDVGAGETAGQAYRLYQAAFARTPDAQGLGYWIGQMDHGLALEDVAGGFVASQEFHDLYGAQPSNLELVSRFYTNVLHRPGEQAGIGN